MILLELAAAFGAGGLLGIAIDSSWAKQRGYRQGFQAALAENVNPKFDTAYDALKREAKAQMDEEVRLRNQPHIPHFAPDHHCTMACYFNEQNGRSNPTT